MCNDSYPLSPFFLYHPYIPHFLIQRIFHFLVSFLFLLHACMYSYQVSNSSSGLVPKIGLLLGQSWMVILTSGKNHFHEMSGDVGMAVWK